MTSYCYNIKPCYWHKMLAPLVLLFGISLFSTAYGSADLLVGVKNSSNSNINNSNEIFTITNVVSSGELATVFVKSELIESNNIYLALTGESASIATINNSTYNFIQSNSANLDDNTDAPAYLWNLNNIDQTDWRFAFRHNNDDYYAKDIKIDNLAKDAALYAFSDDDKNDYYSAADNLSGFIGQNEEKPSFTDNAFPYLTINDGQAILSKTASNDNWQGVNDLVTTSSVYLKVNGVQIEPIAGDSQDLLIAFEGNSQTWTILQEYTDWDDLNIFGTYTDPGIGVNRQRLFSGPDGAGFAYNTNLTAEASIGLWLLNDINGDTIYNGNDSWLFSQRTLTRNSFACQHQWFKVYDVRSYKGSNAAYEFFCSSEDYSTTGDYDYLIFIDDDHTSANWDHNDMIIGVCCNNPPTAACPGDTTIILDQLEEICLSGFACADPDNNLASCDVSLGSLDGDAVCFTPTAAGTYDIILIATDTFGLADTCQTSVTVELNTAPVAICPGDQTMFVCDDEAEICISGFGYIDAENNVVSVQVIGCEIHQDTVCFTPEGALKTITYIVTDAYGAADTCTTTITLSYNQPPIASCPGDTTIFVCDYSEICLPGFIYSDPDNNIANVQIIGCQIHEDTVCFTPESASKTIKLVVTDSCGAADTCQTNISIVLNSAPVITSPNDTTMFVCALDQICLDGFNVSDPDNNIANIAVIGGTLSGSTVCFTPVEGLNAIVITAVDACGVSVESATNVTIQLNSPPEVTCPGDTSLFVCDLSEICIGGFNYSDPDDNIIGVDMTSGAPGGNEICFTPVVGINSLTLTVTDACGAISSCTTLVNVALNTPPTAICPGDTSIFMCSFDEICLPGFISGDVDNNIVSESVSLGTLVDGTVCFEPAKGINTIIYTVTDACGKTSQCQTDINVLTNHAPTATCPGDITMLLCGSGPICLDGFVPADVDNNIASINVSLGTLSGTQVCFTPVEGVNNIIMTVTDVCGQVAQCQTDVTVAFNDSPVVNCPGDAHMTVCSLAEVICTSGFTYSDPNNNITNVTVTGGALSGDQVCFTPVEGVNTITLAVTDACGVTSECSTDITVTLNRAPEVICPGDMQMAVCDLGQICLEGFSYSDPDDNITNVTVTGGTWVKGSICFTPVVGVNTITLAVTDACGVTSTCSTDITISLNNAPVAECPGNTSMLVCDLSEICLDDFTFTDVNNNIASIIITGGTLVGDQVCFTPVVGINTITATVTDSCGASDQCQTQVTIAVNHAPTVSCPGDYAMTVCDLSQICADGFYYNDVDYNVTDITMTGAVLNDTQACFIPVVGTNTLTLTVTDVCGQSATCVTNINVTLNSAPVITAPPSSSMLVCDLSQICLDGFGITDADNNIENIVVTNGTLTGSQVCFTPVVGINTITITATDSCGATSQKITEIDITLNNAPTVTCVSDTTIQVADLSNLCLPGFSYSDPDDNIASIIVSNGMVSGDTLCFTPVEGVNTITITVTDACGLSDQCTSNITVIMNTCPQIVRPLADTTTMCIYEDFCDTIEVIDADGDYIDMAVTYGELTALVDEPGHWLGLYCFNTEDYDCGEHNNYTVVVECDDGVCIDEIITVYDITVLGYIDISMDEDVMILPGSTGLVGVYLNTYDCLCIGGLAVSISYDASVLSIVDIYPTANLDYGNEYYYINQNAFGEGTIKFVYLADLNDQIYHGPLCEINPDEPILYMEFQVAPGEYPSGFELPICYVNPDDVTDNAVTDSTGYNLWGNTACVENPDSSQNDILMLNLECGSVIVMNECDLQAGDLNLNNYPYEVGDVNVLIGYLTDPSENELSLAQLWASDVNGDSIRASIADLIYMLNVISGNNLGKVAPFNGLAEVIIGQPNSGVTSINIQNDYAIGGLVLDLSIPDLANRQIEYNSDLNMDMQATQTDNQLRLLVYSSNGTRINSGTTELLRISNPDGADIGTSEITVADAGGSLANANIVYELPLPEQFGISACYPNPFNPITKISFTMPSSEYITINIYDIGGRLVNKLVDGYYEAGYHEVIWNGTNSADQKISSGVYFAKLSSGNMNLPTSVQKLVLLK